MPKKPMTTTEAFAAMIQLRGIHNDLGLTGGTTRQWRKAVNDHPDDPTRWGITINRMEELLIMTGHKVVQEKLWKL